PALNTTRSGGTPYGASHVAGLKDDPQPDEDEAQLARALGRRVAALVAKLSA
ncbi:MAG: NAD(P)H-quinone oxidoreductase, partial [Gammaproteobacteria bacterium]|nr:NAD(P)H-quinone oxidoreductase [Gammaproteobacteria bacterium]